MGLAFQILNVSEIPDSKTKGFEFQDHKFPGFRNPDYLNGVKR